MVSCASIYSIDISSISNIQMLLQPYSLKNLQSHWGCIVYIIVLLSVILMAAWKTKNGYPQEKEMQKGKMAVWEGLTNSWEKKRREKTKEKRKNISIWMQSSKEEQGKIRKPSSAISAKK